MSYRAGMTIAVVTDSTAGLPTAFAEKVRIVPLSVVIDGVATPEGIATTDEVAAALRNRKMTVTTSRPSPAEFAKVYGELFDAGASGIVSIHLSAALSGTYDSAVAAASELGDRVTVVDARSTAMGLGFPVLAAAEAASAGASLEEVRATAVEATEHTDTYFVVDTLDHLRRGGRIGAASALVGTALSVKPILHVEDGAIVPRDRVRTMSRALDRLVELALAAAGANPSVRAAVHHFDAPDRADLVATALREKLGDRLAEMYLTELTAVIAAHVGPGIVGVVIQH
jgi:DegV family protein with EDD domain